MAVVLARFDVVLIGIASNLIPSGQVADTEARVEQHWIFELVEKDPEFLLAMSDENFRAAMLEAGFDVGELSQHFEQSINKMLAGLRSGNSI